jgi:hypothetical protein
MNYVGIQRKIDRGRGKAAVRLGQPYAVYRVQANAAANYLDASNLIAQRVPALRRIGKGPAVSRALETVPLHALFYEVVADLTTYLVGDVFVQQDPVYGAGATLVSYPTLQMDAMTLVSHAPVKPSLAARIDRLCQIYRIATAPDTTGFFESTVDAALPVVLTSGMWGLGSATQTAAMVPVGLMPVSRMGGTLIPAIPESTARIRYGAVLPPLFGFTLREGDRIVTQDGARYVVMDLFDQEAGVACTAALVEREVAQP